MADFTKTAINQNAKREYASPIASVTAFNEVVNAFKNDTTMGFTKIEQTEVTFKTKVAYFDAASNKCGYVNIYAANASAFEEGPSFLSGNEAAEIFAGVGGQASIDSGDDNWTAKFSCTNVVDEKEDVFTVTIGKDYMSVTGYSYDATLTAIETWADTQPSLA